jgi:hypothetical protein
MPNIRVKFFPLESENFLMMVNACRNMYCIYIF